MPLARQVMISLLSRAIQSAADTVAISVMDEGAQIELAMQYYLAPWRAGKCGPLSDSMLQPMVDQIGWNVRWQVARGGVSLHLPKPLQQKTILCIDDDANFSELLRRYLTGYPVQVLSAANGQQGIEQALQSPPPT